MFELPISTASTNAISSQESEASASPCEERDGLTLDLFGQEAVPAGPSRASAKKLDTQTHGTFGRLGLGSSASDDLQRSLANSLRQLLAGSDLCEVIWRRWVTPWGRCLSRPHARMRNTSEIAIGLWPTATAKADNPQVRGIGASAKHPKRGTTLAGAAFWSTASSRDWKDTPGMATTRERNRKRLDQLPRQVFNSRQLGTTGSASTARCGGLHPVFVSWLMGFPPEWISCAPSATPSIPDLQLLSSAQPCKALEASHDA
jgi:hypothetical protein